MTVDWSVGRLALLVPLSAATLGFGMSLAISLLGASGVVSGDPASDPIGYFFGAGLVIALFGSVLSVPIAFLTQPALLALLQRWGRLNFVNHLMTNALLGPLIAMLFFSLDDRSVGLGDWVSEGTNAIGAATVGFCCAVPCGMTWYAMLVNKPGGKYDD